ncbi:MAG: glycosyltransferase [Scytonema sp. PMC 1069.18]|nr:glycosyltransferase [Scytonema sp. PMC 1069.18]MEC4882329.1 glycosyltransferase [Scytonema sp. PMC 1070.18]
MPKLLFITQRPFYPDSSGGSQHSALYLFKSLCQLGWKVEVICARKLYSPYFWQSCWQSLMHLRIPFPVVMDEDFGYRCWRVITKFADEHRWVKFFEQRLQKYQPDVVLGHSDPKCPLLHYAVRQGYQSFYFARCTDHFETGAVVPDGIHVLANSPFAASVIAQVSDRVPEVILPFIELERYRVSHRQRQYITFINPVPPKGLNVAMEIARHLPQERFLFVKGKWVAYSGQEDALLKSVHTLPNVEVWEHQQDMRRVYAVTDILLFPSQYNETFGRAIVEAQLNGIPVVAANIAGIPYTIGKGGVLIEPIDKPQAYANVLQKLRTDKKLYAEKEALALENSQRPEFDAQYQVRKFVQFVERKIRNKQLSPEHQYSIPKNPVSST